MPILGKLLGIDQQKAIEELKASLGGNSVAEVIDKYGDTHKLKFKISLVDNSLTGEVWLEDKEKSNGS
jgi:hypothetical protein